MISSRCWGFGVRGTLPDNERSGIELDLRRLVLHDVNLN